MHDYSIDRHPKAKVLFSLAFLAIAAAPIIQKWIQKIVDSLDISAEWGAAHVVAIPVFTLFVVLYALFDRVLWRIKWFNKILVVPDLNGRWKCEGKTTLRDGLPADNPWSGTITISQSWTKILIHLQTEASESKSVSASISRENGVGFRLLYQYCNDPNADQHELNKHSGATELRFEENGKSASGNYYTDRHRKTVGTMKLSLQK